MISEELKHIMKFCTNFLYITGAYGVLWVDNGKGVQRIKLQKNKLYLVATGIHFVTIILYEVFLVYRIERFLRTHTTDKTTLLEIVQLFWNLTCYSVPVLYMIQSLKMWNEVYLFINSYLAYFDTLKCKHTNI